MLLPWAVFPERPFIFAKNIYRPFRAEKISPTSFRRFEISFYGWTFSFFTFMGLSTKKVKSYLWVSAVGQIIISAFILKSHCLFLLSHSKTIETASLLLFFVWLLNFFVRILYLFIFCRCYRKFRQMGKTYCRRCAGASIVLRWWDDRQARRTWRWFLYYCRWNGFSDAIQNRRR